MVTFNEGDSSGNYVEQMVEGLNSIDGITGVNVKRGGMIVEWQNHDPDVKFESSLAVGDSQKALTEMTMRFGPVATYDLLPDDRRRELEGMWIDTVLDAQTASRARLDLDARDIDLGDMYISEYARPHVRLKNKVEGYAVSASKLTDFIRELNRRHKEKFGTLEERSTSPRYKGILQLR